MKLPASIFREYDIRGLADSELTDEVSLAIGKAFATVLISEGKKRISVGRDMRLSSDRIHKALLEGLTSCGLDVLDLGLIPTPLLYFSVSHLKLDAGISITGSHNPGEYNGFKFHPADRPFFGTEIQGLKRRIEGQDYADGSRGKVEQSDIIPAYLETVRKLFNFKKKLKVVVDSGHGMGGIVAPEMIRLLGHEVIELYSNLDPSFPDHHPDPSVPDNLRDLQEKVLETSADLGVGFDGDADRIGVVDEKGQVIYGDKILLLYARAILKRKPKATIIGDVKCSQMIYDDINRRGGNAIMWKTGHSLIKAKMKEVKADLAGEMSGHMFFADGWFGFDDAIFAACRMLEIIDDETRPLSELLIDLPKTVSTPEIRVDCPDEQKFDLVKQAVADFKKGYEVIDIDGARILFDGGWGLLRASNTQPVLVMRFEAQDEQRLNEIRAIVEDKVKALSGVS
ncbi:MAG: phosphomannomutase/phosphoglucomutase [Candidatus Omnitrophota bacterium]|nr:phosphomannomutase/phosphoglucomutase [Candidatus Omnitrophota bacterium]